MLTFRQLPDKMIPMKQKRPDKLSDQLRQIVEDCGLGQNEIARRAGVDKSALSRFVNGERGLSMKALDKVGKCLGLSFTTRGKFKKRKGG